MTNHKILPTFSVVVHEKLPFTTGKGDWDWAQHTITSRADLRSCIDAIELRGNKYKVFVSFCGSKITAPPKGRCVSSFVASLLYLE